MSPDQQQCFQKSAIVPVSSENVLKLNTSKTEVYIVGRRKSKTILPMVKSSKAILYFSVTLSETLESFLNKTQQQTEDLLLPLSSQLESTHWTSESGVVASSLPPDQSCNHHHSSTTSACG